jgi:predicted enzyme related to lactoylglutathione lyase
MALRAADLGQVVISSSKTGAVNDPQIEVTDIIMDCSDPEKLARFWSSLLKRPVEGRKGPYVWLVRAPGGTGLGFQKVEEPKRGKNRLHIDISGPDVAAIKRKVEDLGGRRVSGYEDGGFLVMADPEDNEFCVVPPELHFDDLGRTDYFPNFDS